MTRTSRRLGWLFLVLYSLFGATWGREFVLCLESDGHVALEAGLDCSSCCTDERTGPDEIPPSLSACPCSDVAISVAESVQVRVAGAGLDVPSCASLGSNAELAPAPVVRPPLRPRGLPHSHASGALGALRTVVILV